MKDVVYTLKGDICGVDEAGWVLELEPTKRCEGSLFCFVFLSAELNNQNR
jgi:hypothetical protein